MSSFRQQFSPPSSKPPRAHTSSFTSSPSSASSSSSPSSSSWWRCRSSSIIIESSSILSRFVTTVSTHRRRSSIIIISPLPLSYSLIFILLCATVLLAHGNLICRRIPNLTPSQVHVCERSPEALSVVRRGVQLAYAQCERMLASHPIGHVAWNCSAWMQNSNSRFFVDITHPEVSGTKEASFAYSLFSAGITYALSEACTRSNYSYCECGRPPGSGPTGDDTRPISSWTSAWTSAAPKQSEMMFDDGVSADDSMLDDDGWPLGPSAAKREAQLNMKWKWNGCHHNVEYGVELARHFLDGAEHDRRSPYALANLHNNCVGRRVLKDEYTRRCQCHGYSGSCTTRTCWQTIGVFPSAAYNLYDRYRNAKLVTYGWLARTYRAKLESRRSRQKKVITKKSVRSTQTMRIEISPSSMTSTTMTMTTPTATTTTTITTPTDPSSSSSSRDKVSAKLQWLESLQAVMHEAARLELNLPNAMRDATPMFAGDHDHYGREGRWGSAAASSSGNSRDLDIQKRDLIYVKQSIDRCAKRRSRYAESTTGPRGQRAPPPAPAQNCRVNSTTGPDCATVCCGRGYRPIKRIKRTEQCDCQFRFCCSIDCRSRCSIREIEYECL